MIYLEQRIDIKIYISLNLQVRHLACEKKQGNEEMLRARALTGTKGVQIIGDFLKDDGLKTVPNSSSWLL